MPNTEHRGTAEGIDQQRSRERDRELADRKAVADREAERQRQAKFAADKEKRKQERFDATHRKMSPHPSHVQRARAQDDRIFGAAKAFNIFGSEERRRAFFSRGQHKPHQNEKFTDADARRIDKENAADERKRARQ